MRQRLTILLLIAILLICPMSLHAQSEVEISATPAFDGNYRPGTWLPITVTLNNSGPALDLLLTAALPNATFQHTLNVDLPSGASKEERIYVAMEQPASQIRLTVEQNGSILASREIEVRPRPDERLFAAVSEPPLDLRLPRRQDLARLPFVDLPLTPADLPERSAGLGSLLLIMLGDLPAETLSPAQQHALLGWVHNGGHLLIGGGPAAETVLSNLPAQLQAAGIGAATRLDPAPLADYVAAAAPTELPGVELQPLPGTQIFGSAEAPLWVERAFGQGRVTQLAFAPGGAALRDWPAAPLFWDRLLQPTRLIPSAFGPAPSVDVQQEQSITAALGYLPTQNLPPSGTFFGLLAIYTILIGPGLALLLRYFDRQAFGWLLLPLLALLVSGAAFAMAFALRTDQRLVSEISLLERIADDQVRVRSLSAMLAPQTITTTVTAAPGALIRPIRAVGGPFGSLEGVQGDLAQQQQQQAVPFDAWSLQGIYAETRRRLPPLDARLELSDAGISAFVRNTGEQQLYDVVLAYGTQFVRLGDIPPAGEARAEWPAGAPGPPGATLGNLVFQQELAAGRAPGGLPARGAVQREVLLNAAVARANGTTAAGPFLFAWLDASPLPLTITADAAARRSTNLLVDQPDMVASGTVELPTGWLRLDLTADNRPICFGSAGQGIVAQPAPVTATLRLPPDLAGLRAEMVTLDLAGERRWPNSGITTELYDWQRERWVDLDYDGPGEIRVDDAAAYLGRGTLRLRISGPIESVGCLFISANLRATAP
jgi:hypothetical protein